MKDIILKQMNKFKFKKIVPISLAIVLVIVIMAGLTSIVPDLFGRRVVDSSGSEALLGVSADSGVRMVVRGPIVADENFKTYQLDITPNQRSLSVINGYTGQPIKIEYIDNNLPAYEQLVYALDKANLARTPAFSGSANDLRGICASGRLYDFQILEADRVVKNYWTSTCSGSKGSLNANLEQVSSLFYSQIDKSESIVGELWK